MDLTSVQRKRGESIVLFLGYFCNLDVSAVVKFAKVPRTFLFNLFNQIVLSNQIIKFVALVSYVRWLEHLIFAFCLISSS